MGIYRGDTPITAIRLGGQEINAVYKGSDLVWTKAGVNVNFAQLPDSNTLAAAGFVNYGPSSDYHAGVVNKQCRMAITDQGVGAIGYHTDYARYDDAVVTQDDARLRFQVGSQGSGPVSASDHFRTELFLRGANANQNFGVGVRLEASQMWIVRRVSGTTSPMVDCGAFAPSDVIQLTPNGNLFTLTRNGAFVDEWDDTGASASSGAGYRSLLIRVDGVRTIFNQRYFSPAINWVEYR